MSATDSPTDPLTVPAVAKLTHHSTDAVRRWMALGVLVNGRRVRLAGERVGGRWFVTREALERFRRECNPDAPPVAESPTAEAKRFRADVEEYRRLVGRR